MFLGSRLHLQPRSRRYTSRSYCPGPRIPTPRPVLLGPLRELRREAARPSQANWWRNISDKHSLHHLSGFFFHGGSIPLRVLGSAPRAVFRPSRREPLFPPVIK